MDLIVSGSDEAILMVECGATGVTEAEILDALDIAHSEIKKIVAARSRSCAARPARRSSRSRSRRSTPRCSTRSAARTAAKLDEATQVPEKLARQDAIDADRGGGRRASTPPSSDDEERRSPSAPPRSRAPSRSSRRTSSGERIAVDKKRPDGRAQDEIRPIETEVDVAPRAHGSALFTRGETQILSSVALGTTRMDMKVDNLGLDETKRFWHHYNFPPFSVGEAGFMRGPKRRDIGHGALAERALAATIPDRGGLSLRDPGRLRHARVQRVVLDGLGLRVVDGAAGRRRAGLRAGRRRRDGADQGGRRATSCSPTSPASRTTSATWTSRSPATADGITALQMDIKITRRHLRHPARGARAGAGRAGCSSSSKMDETIDGPREQLVAVRAADRVDPDRSRQDRRRHRQGRRDDPRPPGGVRGRDRRRRRRHRSRLRRQRRAGRRLHRAIQAMTKEAEVGDRFTRQGRQDDHLRRLRRADEGHRRPAPHLQRQARRARRHGRGRAEPGRRARRHRGRGRPRARPHRPAALATTPRSRASRRRS